MGQLDQDAVAEWSSDRLTGGREQDSSFSSLISSINLALRRTSDPKVRQLLTQALVTANDLRSGIAATSARQLPVTAVSGTILVVEDHPDLSFFACEALKAAGYDAVAARDGFDALTKISENDEIAAIFSDIVLPGPIDGVDLARIVNRDHPKIAILLTTGFSEDVHLDLGSSGFDVLVKPYTSESLQAALHKSISTPENRIITAAMAIA